MDNKRIIKNYLPLLQDLQTKVANHGRDVCMEIHCSSLGISTTMSREIDNPEFPREIMHEHFNIGYTEDEMDQKIICLNAFFAEACTTSITGINYHIINN